MYEFLGQYFFLMELNCVFYCVYKEIRRQSRRYLWLGLLDFFVNFYKVFEKKDIVEFLEEKIFKCVISFGFFLSFLLFVCFYFVYYYFLKFVIYGFFVLEGVFSVFVFFGRFLIGKVLQIWFCLNQVVVVLFVSWRKIFFLIRIVEMLGIQVSFQYY